jgi:hypothetical protein
MRQYPSIGLVGLLAIACRRRVRNRHQSAKQRSLDQHPELSVSGRGRDPERPDHGRHDSEMVEAAWGKRFG